MAVERDVRRLGIDRVLSVMPEREFRDDPASPLRKPKLSVPVTRIEVDDLENDGPWDAETHAFIAERGLTLPNADHVAAILAAGAEALRDAAEGKSVRMLVHCSAGLSRSPAAALLILALEDGAGEEERSVERLAEIDPECLPNDRIVRLGDEVLGRDGRLREACATRFRTEPRKSA
jgi:predicted protein tyrosine phosphatase